MNSAPTLTKLSIRLTPDGFSFLLLDPEGGATPLSGSLAEVLAASDDPSPLVETPHGGVVLVPREVFEPQRTEQYLRASNRLVAGMANLYNDTLSERAAALWQAPAEWVDLCRTHAPDAIHYHPLQLLLDFEASGTVFLLIEQGWAHLALYKEGISLYAAESLPFHTPDDLLYYLFRLLKQDGFTSYCLVLITPEAARWEPFFAPHFLRIEPVDDPHYIPRAVYRRYADHWR